MSRERLDEYCERGILCLVLAILILGPLALGAVRALEFALIQVLTLAVAVLWVVRLWIAPKAQLLWPPICWAVLAFVAYAIARYFTADVEYIARRELLRVLVYALLFVVILNNLHRQETTTIISFTLIFLALAIAAYAVYQFLRNSDFVWTFLKPYPHRGSGTYICPNHLAGFLEMLFPLALAYTIAGRLKPLTRILVGYAALVIVAGIAVSLSRGAWISTVVALLLLVGVLLFRPHCRLPALILVVIIAGAGVFAASKSDFIQARLNALVGPRAPTTDDMRLALWTPAWRMWREHPWWGVGPAHFDVRFRAYRPEAVQLTPDRVHNDYLNTLTDWGVVGTALVASAWILLAIGVVQTWRSRRLAPADIGGKSTSNKYAFLLGASLGLLALLVHSFVDFNLHIPANAILAVALMALLTAHLRFATDRFWFRARLWTRLAATFAALAAVAFMAPQARRQAAEFVYLDRAQRVPSFSVDQVALLKRAFEVEPKNPLTAYLTGEALRHQSQEGGQYYQGQAGVDYVKLTHEAMEWYQRGMRLNPWDSRSYAGYGWCLDWLDRSKEAGPYFQRAEELDPNNYFILNDIGLHYVALRDYAAARPWFERSARLQWSDNEIATSYLKIIQVKLLDAATNNLSSRLDLSPK